MSEDDKEDSHTPSSQRGKSIPGKGTPLLLPSSENSKQTLSLDTAQRQELDNTEQKE